MLKNYITTTYLKGKTPELDEYLWTGETDYTNEQQSAEDAVKSDFIDRNFQIRLLRPKYTVLTTVDVTYPDVANRDRCIIDCTTFTGTASITVKGSNDADAVAGDYEDAGTSSSLAAGINTFVLDDIFKYYIYSVTGTATIAEVALVEGANYDLLYAYMWLYFILKNKMVRKEDQFDTKADEFLRLYSERWKNFSPYYDSDDDGTLTASERTGIIIRDVIH